MRGLKRKEPWEEETEWCCVCLGLRSRPLRSDQTAHLSANTWSLTSGRPLRLYQHVSGFRQGLESLPLATSATKAFSSTCGIKSQILNFRERLLEQVPLISHSSPPLQPNGTTGNSSQNAISSYSLDLYLEVGMSSLIHKLGSCVSLKKQVLVIQVLQCLDFQFTF